MMFDTCERGLGRKWKFWDCLIGQKKWQWIDKKADIGQVLTRVKKAETDPLNSR